MKSTYYMLRSAKTGRLYKDHGARLLTTSDVMQASSYLKKDVKVAAKQINEEFPGHQFIPVAVQANYSYWNVL